MFQTLSMNWKTTKRIGYKRSTHADTEGT